MSQSWLLALFLTRNNQAKQIVFVFSLKCLTLTFMTSFAAHVTEIAVATMSDAIFLTCHSFTKSVFCSDELSCEL